MEVVPFFYPPSPWLVEKELDGRRLPGFYVGREFLLLRRALGRYTHFSDFYIPAVRSRLISNLREDYLNPAYLPREYTEDLFDGRGELKQIAGFKDLDKGDYSNVPALYDVELLRFGIKRVSRTVHLIPNGRLSRVSRDLRHQYARMF